MSQRSRQAEHNLRVWQAVTVRFGPVGEEALGPNMEYGRRIRAEELRDEITGLSVAERVAWVRATASRP